MRGWMLLLVIPVSLCTQAASAQAPTFPYDAIINADDVHVRSGPGKEGYYPTMRLKRGDKVTVHRHDPGGWYMIAPPQGSFNWIRAAHVQRNGARGVVIENDSVVGIGSDFGDTYDVWHTKLSKGDEVVILGEKTIQDERGAVPMLKIQPPKNEWRWISGQYVTLPRDIAQRGPSQPQSPPQQPQQQPSAGDPFAPPMTVPFGEPDPLPAASAPQVKPVSQPKAAPQAGSPEPPPMTVPAPGADAFHEPEPIPRTEGSSVRTMSPERSAERARLKELDDAFRDMQTKTTAEWQLEPIEAGYRELQQTTADPVIAAQIDNRFTLMERYKKIKHEYDEFIKLTTDTDKRDKQLLSANPRQAPAKAPNAQQQQPAPQQQPDGAWKQAEPASPFQPPVQGLQQQQTQSAPEATQVTPQQGPAMQPSAQGAQTFQQSQAPPQGQPYSPPRSQPVSGNPPMNTQPMNTPPANPAPTAIGQGGRIAPPPVNQSRRLDGAGIIQRSAQARPGIPQHVLVSPEGRILAYLEPAPGVNLDQAIGQQMGIVGQRNFRQDLRADQITVQGMMPVRLSPSRVGGLR